MRDFVAIDFETANEQRRSACSVGLVRFDEAGQALEQLSTLLHPHSECDYFLPMNTGIHGIDAAQVVDAPAWDEVAADIYDFIADAPLVAHNMAFDGYVLSDLAELYGLRPLQNRRFCTMRLARRILADELDRKRLHDVYGYYFPDESFDHHEAGADAMASGRIFARMLEDYGWQEIETLCPEPGTRRQASMPSKVDPAAAADLIARYGSAAGALTGERICLTGTLQRGRRVDIQGLISALGGSNEASLTAHTTILVVGTPDPRAAAAKAPSGKLKKALARREKGAMIDVVTEEQFFQRLLEYGEV